MLKKKLDLGQRYHFSTQKGIDLNHIKVFNITKAELGPDVLYATENPKMSSWNCLSSLLISLYRQKEAKLVAAYQIQVVLCLRSIHSRLLP
jgi:hypothetical protein